MSTDYKIGNNLSSLIFKQGTTSTIIKRCYYGSNLIYIIPPSLSVSFADSIATLKINNNLDLPVTAIGTFTCNGTSQDINISIASESSVLIDFNSIFLTKPSMRANIYIQYNSIISHTSSK